MKKTLMILAVVLTTTLIAQEKTSEPMRPALIVIDVQNQFLTMVEQREKDVSFYMINAYIAEFRLRGLPIIRVYHSDSTYGIYPGVSGFEFSPDIAISPDDPMVIKHYGNSFNKTDLEKVLREKGVNTVFLCGLSSVSVLATWFGAKDLDLKAFLLKDSMMSHSSTYTNQVEDMFDAVGWEAVEAMIE